MAPSFRHFNMTLVGWALRKFKRLKRRKKQACIFLINLAKKCPKLFVHWKPGVGTVFA
jgi:hypothetical protein